MNRADIVVGVERVLEDIGQTAKWNQKKLTWTITHHNPTFTRQHQIQLEMTLISSERIVKVDGNFKLRQMCSFGFKCEFQIAPGLQGKIVQDGLTFQLYVNDKSFTQCSRQNYKYEPPLQDFQEKSASNYGYQKGCSQKDRGLVFLKKTDDRGKQKQGEKVEKAIRNIDYLDRKVGEKKVEENLKQMQNQTLKILIGMKKSKKSGKEEGNSAQQ